MLLHYPFLPAWYLLRIVRELYMYTDRATIGRKGYFRGLRRIDGRDTRQEYFGKPTLAWLIVW